MLLSAETHCFRSRMYLVQWAWPVSRTSPPFDLSSITPSLNRPMASLMKYVNTSNAVLKNSVAKGLEGRGGGTSPTVAFSPSPPPPPMAWAGGDGGDEAAAVAPVVGWEARMRSRIACRGS